MGFQYLSHQFDKETKTASFQYFVNGFTFTESAIFSEVSENYDAVALESALFLAGILIGASYYKTFPTSEFQITDGRLDQWQSEFFNSVYQEGFSQFAFENNLTRSDLAHFTATLAGDDVKRTDQSETTGSPIVLQSGGKDSLLLAELLTQKKVGFNPWYVSSTDSHPVVLSDLSLPVSVVTRKLDLGNLQKAKESGALNGHIPVTYIVLSLAIIEAILTGKNTVLTAIGHEGEEPYTYVDDLPVRHQWAKIWQSEIQFAEYVRRYISPELHVGSPLRQFSELKIAELFVTHCWEKYSRSFSSCNVGNYKQGQNNEKLGWCGKCAKCANSFLLFAPFVDASELMDVFNGENLLKKESLIETFKGLMDIDEVAKPFECVGETDELRLAYHMAVARSPQYSLPFDVPESTFDYNMLYSAQQWATDLIT